jgi:oxalate decarboxylase
MRSKGNAKGLSMNDGDGKAGAPLRPSRLAATWEQQSLAQRTPREAESRISLAPPPTDHGTLASLKWSFADCHNRLQPNGRSRQTTGRELHYQSASRRLSRLHRHGSHVSKLLR